MTSVELMTDEAAPTQTIVPGASESSALRGIVPVQTTSEEITVPVVVEPHSKDSVAVERGIEPIDPSNEAASS